MRDLDELDPETQPTPEELAQLEDAAPRCGAQLLQRHALAPGGPALRAAAPGGLRTRRADVPLGDQRRRRHPQDADLLAPAAPDADLRRGRDAPARPRADRASRWRRSGASAGSARCTRGRSSGCSPRACSTPCFSARWRSRRSPANCRFGGFAPHLADFPLKLVIAAGAGFYEEAFFRFAILGAMFYLAKEVGKLRPFTAGALALVLSGARLQRGALPGRRRGAGTRDLHLSPGRRDDPRLGLPHPRLRHRRLDPRDLRPLRPLLRGRRLNCMPLVCKIHLRIPCLAGT